MTHYFRELWSTIRENPRTYLVRAIFFLFVFWFVFGDFGLVTRITMERDHRVLRELVAREQKKIGADRAVIQNAFQPDSIEKVARERYNFRKKGETVFIIRP